MKSRSQRQKFSPSIYSVCSNLNQNTSTCTNTETMDRLNFNDALWRSDAHYDRHQWKAFWSKHVSHCRGIQREIILSAIQEKNLIACGIAALPKRDSHSARLKCAKLKKKNRILKWIKWHGEIKFPAELPDSTIVEAGVSNGITWHDHVKKA